MRIRVPPRGATDVMPDAGIDGYVIDGRHCLVIQCKAGMGKTHALVGALLAERVAIRRELEALETANVITRVTDLLVPDPSTIKQLVLARERQAMREHIARLQRLLQLLNGLIRLVLRYSRSWADRTQVFLLERSWFLYHGDRPPRFLSARAGVLTDMGRMCSSPATA
jgi:hypothetical protein